MGWIVQMSRNVKPKKNKISVLKKIEDYYADVADYKGKESAEEPNKQTPPKSAYVVKDFGRLKKLLLYPTTLMDNNFLRILVAVATGLSINILTNLLNFNDSSNWLEFAFLFFQFAVAVVFNISLILLTIRCSTFKDFIEIDSERAKDDAQRKYKIDLLTKYDKCYKKIAVDFVLSAVTLTIILIVIIIIPIVLAVVNLIGGMV